MRIINTSEEMTYALERRIKLKVEILELQQELKEIEDDITKAIVEDKYSDLLKVDWTRVNSFWGIRDVSK